MSRLAWDDTAKHLSRDQILMREGEQGNFNYEQSEFLIGKGHHLLSGLSQKCFRSFKEYSLLATGFSL